MSNRLKSIFFKLSKAEKCIVYRGNYLFLFNVDDDILLCPDTKQVDKTIEEYKETGLELEDRGDIADYLGIYFDYKKDRIL